MIALLLLAAYVLGATPTSLWVGRAFFGIDLRHEGSGNLGATNAFRVLGWKAAVPVMLFDILKGWVPVAIGPSLLSTELAPGWLAAVGGAAILGHVFSFWVGFRGGKGVATSAGVFLALAPLGVLAALAVWVAAIALTGYVSLGSILAALVLPFAVALTPHRGGDVVLVFSIAIAAFVIWAHRGNMRRLLSGTENRIGRSKAAEPPGGQA